MRGGWLAVVVALGCGLDEPPPQVLDPVCGREGPMELLRLDADTTAWAIGIGGSTDLRVLAGERSVVLGECGERLAEVDPSVFNFRWLGNTLLGWTRRDVSEDADLMAWSAYDGDQSTVARRATTLLFQDGMLVLEPHETLEQSRLLWVRDGDEGLAITELVDDADLGPNPGVGVVTVGAQVLIQTVGDGVISLDPHTGHAEPMLPHPRAWTANHRWLAHAEPADDAGVHAVYVRDRETGVDQRLAADVPAAWDASLHLSSEQVLRVIGGPGNARWFHLDPPREISAPQNATVLGVHPDGAAWWFVPDHDRSLGSLWFQTSQGARHVVRHGARMWAIDRHEAWIDFATRRGSDPFLDVYRATPDGQLRRIAIIDDTRSIVDEDGRHLTFQGSGDYGPLVLYDGVDPEGITVLPWVDRDTTSRSVHYGDFEDIIYESDPATGTHALFRARIADR